VAGRGKAKAPGADSGDESACGPGELSRLRVRPVSGGLGGQEDLGKGQHLRDCFRRPLDGCMENLLENAASGERWLQSLGKG
jgi:hypothetical protein